MSFQNHPVHLVGGRICLDFLNTANWAASGDVAVERLTSVEDLTIWKRAVCLVNDLDMDGTESRDTVLKFRRSLRQIVLASIHDEEPSPSDITRFNKALGQPKHSGTIEFSHGVLALNPALSFTKTMALLAVSMLTDKHEISRVKMCPAESCGWLFLDESKNRRRHWCSMELCGNRAKARRHYERRGHGKVT